MKRWLHPGPHYLLEKFLKVGRKGSWDWLLITSFFELRPSPPMTLVWSCQTFIFRNHVRIYTPWHQHNHWWGPNMRDLLQFPSTEEEVPGFDLLTIPNWSMWVAQPLQHRNNLPWPAENQIQLEIILQVILIFPSTCLANRQLQQQKRQVCTVQYPDATRFAISSPHYPPPI